MLKEKLEPLLQELAKVNTDKDKYDIIKNYFSQHEENLASDIEELVTLCQLPAEERCFVAYPVLGNWLLERLHKFDTKTEYASNVKNQLEYLIREKRFNNSHLKEFYKEQIPFHTAWDNVTNLMLQKPEESMPFHLLLHQALLDVGDVLDTVERPSNLQVDLGHGFFAPVFHFEFLTFYYRVAVEDNHTKPLGLTIMLVDDQEPQQWYDRLISAGFTKHPNGKGFFYDCESALEALTKSNYDVILTDLDLGKGKMPGIKFVQKAFQIQKQRGVLPLISVFSYNEKLLKEAEDKLHWNLEESMVFHQVNHDGNKMSFTTSHFCKNVHDAIERYKKFT